MTSINRIVKHIIAWANANSGFISMLGLLIGSGLVTCFFKLQTPKELWREINRTWKNGKVLWRKIYQITKRFIKYVIIVLARICLVVVIAYILIVSVFMQGGRQTVESSITTNHVKLDADGPLEKRVEIPITSLYPDVDMMAAELTDRNDLPWNAISTPFLSNDPSEMVKELEIEILKNPLVGDMVVQGFGIVEDYSTDMFSDYTGSKSWTEAIYREFQEEYERGSGLSHWLATYRFDDGKTGTYVTDEYRCYAELICQHLESYYPLGLAQEKAEQEYQRCYTLTVDKLRAIPYRDVEAKEALVLSEYNNTNSPIYMIGFAVKDKRLIIYEIAGKG